MATDIVGSTGGKELAVCRLAELLFERGHDVTLWFGLGEPPTDYSVPFRHMSEFAKPWPSGAPTEAAKALEAAKSDVMVLSIDWADAALRFSESVPVILNSQLLTPVCPDTAKYWARFGRACTVSAGRKCLALRPLMGCSGFPQAVQQAPYRAHRALLTLVRSGRIGMFVPSADLRRRCLDLGVPERAVAVVPNLGLRLKRSELRKAAEGIPIGHRDKVLYLGRLSHTKGAHLLPGLAKKLERSRLAIFGDGYLKAMVAQKLGEAVNGTVSQEMIAGLLLWARSLAFTSVWPEPGGIVGIDSQLFGVPTGTFDLGAPLDWPVATRFAAGDIGSMASWLDERPERKRPRDFAEVSSALTRYWNRTGDEAETKLNCFVRNGFFEEDLPNPVGAALSFSMNGFI